MTFFCHIGVSNCRVQGKVPSKLEYVPARHAAHSAEEVAPMELLYNPAPQSWQTVAPVRKPRF
jgi:hypothetical protein